MTDANDNERDGAEGISGPISVFNEDWAKVELFRWQYGELPQPGDRRNLDIAAGLIGMAKGIKAGCQAGDTSLMPHPENVCEVLKFCASKLG